MANIQFVRDGEVWDYDRVIDLASKVLEADATLVRSNFLGIPGQIAAGQTFHAMLVHAEKERQEAAREEAQDDVLFWHLRERILNFLVDHFTPCVEQPKPASPPVSASVTVKANKTGDALVPKSAPDSPPPPPRTILTLRLCTDPEDTDATAAMFQTVAEFIRTLENGITLQGVDVKTGGK